MMERTFRASRFDDALAQVKRDLGPEAVIISSRQISSGILGRPQVEVRAVSHQEAVELGIAPTERKKDSPDHIERRLVRAGIPATAARSIAQHIRDQHSGEPPSLGVARDALCSALEGELSFAGPVSRRSPRAIALIGPTGVGKTTTIAKIAAQAALIEGRSVALVSIDQYRVGGAEQLERYADLIGIPLETAHDQHSLEIALRRLGDASLVLIDTAGRSPRDQVALAAMAECLHGVQEPVEIHLCLPAGMRDCEINACIDRHAVLRPAKLISTKLDEAVYHGSIVAAFVTGGLPLSYFTTGQRVPEDIEPASAERLADLLCGEEVH